MRRRIIVSTLVVMLIAGALFYSYGRAMWMPLYVRVFGARTVADVVTKFGPAARARLEPHFRRAGVSYPPKRIAMLAFKKERRLVLWAANDRQPWRYIRAYPILAASGNAGPKLREGDYQVPEGVYRIEHLNPNSAYHLSMKVNYPNAFDQQMAARDGRTRLGGDIFIHGKSVSIGCVAVGDAAIEELFTLVAQTGHQRVKVIVAPNDLRTGGAVMHERAPLWVSTLYRTIAAALVEFPVAMEADLAFDVRGTPKAKVIPLPK